MIRRGLLALVLCSASPALAEFPLLHSPVDCDLNGPCYIQQYKDRDPGPGHTDYQCSTLSYNRHTGTDFAVVNREMMRRGVNVIAAAPGRVRGTRDGMSDAGLTDETRAKIGNRPCGNGVVLEHGDGWATQYCHLKNGSIAVEKGDWVERGTVLGQIGQSGRAEFPHVHFTLRKHDVPIDPFDLDGELQCGADQGRHAWAELPPYRPGGVLEVGFSTAVPDYKDVKEGTAAVATLDTKADAIVMYAFSFGTRAGDVLKMEITGPDDFSVSNETTMERAHAQAFRAMGSKRRFGRSWAEGTYQATARLVRDGKLVNEVTTQIEVLP